VSLRRRPPLRRRSTAEAASSNLPAGNIDFPAPGAVVPRTPLIVTGWALGADGPAAKMLVLINGGRPTEARLGSSSRDDVGAEYPGVPDAARSGWDAVLDVRDVPGPDATLTALARTGSGWTEVASLEIQLEAPQPASDGRHAVFTIARDESTFLPIWLEYYGRHYDPADIYVLDNDSSDASTDGLEGRCHVVPVHRAASAGEGSASILLWLKGTVEDFQRFLLRSYTTVLFAEIDEFVVPDPARHPSLGAYIANLEGPAACCSGYNVVHYPEEPAIDFGRPLLRQRRYWHPSPHWYSKRLLSRIPLSWSIGFHDEYNAPDAKPDPDLCLVHLHRVDYEYCLERHRRSAGHQWSANDLQFNLSWHQRIAEPEEFREWFFHGEDLEGPGREEIPERIRDLL
jgi:glycosyl transferase family 2